MNQPAQADEVITTSAPNVIVAVTLALLPPDPLQSLLVESVQQAAQTFSLDGLLQESMEASTAREAEKELRKKVARGSGSADELAADKAMLRQWDRQREWKREANVLMFTRQCCTSCGSYHCTVEGRFERHVHTRGVKADWLSAVTAFEIPTLPREVKYHDAVVTVCHDCGDNDGWPLEEE